MLFLRGLLYGIWLVVRGGAVWLAGLGIFLLPGGLVLLWLLGRAWQRMGGPSTPNELPESGGMPAAAQLSPGSGPPAR